MYYRAWKKNTFDTYVLSEFDIYNKDIRCWECKQDVGAEMYVFTSIYATIVGIKLNSKEIKLQIVNKQEQKKQSLKFRVIFFFSSYLSHFNFYSTFSFLFPVILLFYFFSFFGVIEL